MSKLTKATKDTTSRQNKATSRPDDEQYVKFLRGLKLMGLGLKSSAATLNRRVFFELDESKSIRRLSESYTLSRTGKGFFEAEGRYNVRIADGDNLGMEVQCIFEVHMHTDGPAVDREMAERFSKTDLRFVLLPYARQFITGITAQMQIPPLILPMATAAGMARAETRDQEED